jgi:hypothetical protein
MSTNKKLRPGNSELTRLKVLWRDSLTDEARDYWRSQFLSSDFTQAELRKQMFARLKINLRHDSQLNAFRDWEMEQRSRDLEAERMQEDERRLQEEFGSDWTLDQIREEVLKRSYARALATGDFASGRKTIVQDLNVKKVAQDERKLLILEKKAAQLDQVKEVMDAKLSPEEQRKRLKEILK